MSEETVVARGASSCTSLETTHGYWSSAEDAENAFLEDVFGDEALSFAKQMNAATVSALGEPTQSEYYEKVLAILESKDKIPHLRRIRGMYYNFWQDAANPRGVIRRTASLEAYMRAAVGHRSSVPPEQEHAERAANGEKSTEGEVDLWEVVLDIDALGAAEGQSWVYKGQTPLEIPFYERMAAERGDPSLHPHRTLISLSPGGGDAVVIREFDLTHKVFVAPEPTPHSASESSNSTSTTTACPVKLYNGFYIPVAKSRVDWYSPDVLIIGTDFHALRSKEKESADTSTNTASASITAVVDASNKQSCDNAKDLPSVTDSGYPISTSLWRRGTPITSAVETFRGESTDVSVSGYISHHRGISIEWRSRAITFYTGAYQIRDWNPPMLDGTDGADALKLGSQSEWFDLSKVLPDDVDLSCFADCLLIQLRSDWTPVNTTYSQGSLLSVRISDIKSNGIANCNFEILFEPTEDRSLESFSCTQNFIILSALVRVKSELSFWRYNDIKSETATAGADTITSASTKLSPAWTFCGSESSAQVRGISISPVDSDACDAYFATCNSFLQPSIYFLCDAAAGPDGVPRLDNALLNMTTTTTTSSSRTGSGVEDELTRLLPSCPLKLRSLPAQFNADGLVEYQREATSPDGTKIPYFVIGRRNMALDGSTPTLLYGYGGFEISLTPSYLAATGLTWLEQGGCYVVANIRGGGEFGPSWHQAALKQNRHKAYEDFAAVAEDLIRSGITRREKLAIRGGSNGGLLVGNLMVRRPDLFAAVICAVPLLDMKRYNKLLAGASWMAEYGNPDTEDWPAFLHRYSAYHNIQRRAPVYTPSSNEAPVINTSGSGTNGTSVSAAAESSTTVVPTLRYPALLMTTSTRDDRVHPYHARAFVRRLIHQCDKEVLAPVATNSTTNATSATSVTTVTTTTTCVDTDSSIPMSTSISATTTTSSSVLYYENTEGGHGGAADAKQQAYVHILNTAFLRAYLGMDSI